MANMFSENKGKTLPKSFKECYQLDNVTINLWTWAERLETLGKFFATVIAIAIIIYGIVLESMEYYDGIAILICIFTAPLAAFLEYISFHLIALLIGALASIVQHTKINANLNLYNTLKEEFPSILTTSKNETVKNNKPSVNAVVDNLSNS